MAGAVDPAKPFLLSTIDIRRRQISGLQASGDECSAQRIARLAQRDVQRPIDAMIVVSATRMSFSTPEIGQYLVIAPTAAARLGPAVEVAGMAADVAHTVHGGGTAQHPAARMVDAATVQEWLWLGPVGPIIPRALQRIGQG